MNLSKLVKLIAMALMLDPLFRVLFFKISTKLEFSVVWNNIVENSLSSAGMFTEYWVLAPLTGILLLSSMKLGQHLYMLLTVFNIYSLFTYEAFSWPYFSKTPHWSAFILMSINVLMVGILYWPMIKKYFLSKHLRNVFDARGRNISNLAGSLFINNKGIEQVGTVVNISSGGALFSLEKEAGEKITNKDNGLIIIKDTMNNYLSLNIDIVNYRVEGELVFLGVEFKGVNSSLRIKILDFLQSSSTEKSEHSYATHTVSAKY